MSKADEMVYEDGGVVGRYSTIGNDVIEKIADVDMTRSERKVLARVIQDTISYDAECYSIKHTKRVTYTIPMIRFKQKTGLTEQEITPALENLETRRIIKRNGDIITFNTHLTEWV